MEVSRSTNFLIYMVLSNPIIALTPQLRCAEGYGCLFLTPKKPMLLCSLMLQIEAGVLLQR